jgi:hypothetical protein
MSFNKALETIESLHLPEGIEFYAVDGQKLFPIRESSGVSTSSICYLIHKDGNFASVQPIEFTYLSAQDPLPKLIAALTQFRQDLLAKTTRVVSLDAGLLGRESDKPIIFL